MPKARALLDAASLGPEALKAVGQAFDEAWSEIASHFAHDAVEGARLSLANALLSIADDASRDVQVLKKAGLQVMAQNYTSLPIGPKIHLEMEALTETYWLNRAEEARIMARTMRDPLVQNELRDIIERSSAAPRISSPSKYPSMAVLVRSM
jgi:hypothetical protein